MVLRFIKTNWFPVAIIVLVLIAIVRRSLQSGGGSREPGEEASLVQDKYTDGGRPGATARLGFLPGGEDEKALGADAAATEAYLRRFSKVAMSERKKFGIPASVLLAHACVASRAGAHPAAADANNYTALPCLSDWDGATSTVDGVCFRKYETPWESFRDLSIYLAGQSWVAATRDDAGMDWEPWVQAFRKHVGGGASGYEQSMTRLIKSYRLYELDR